MDVTSTKRCTPRSLAALMRLMFPSESALGSAVVPPIVETTTLRSSMLSMTALHLPASSASPLMVMPPFISISFWNVCERLKTLSHAPSSSSVLHTSLPTPAPAIEMTAGMPSASVPPGVNDDNNYKESEP